MQADLPLSLRHLSGTPSASQRERGAFLLLVSIVPALLACFLVQAIWGMPQWLIALPFALSLFFCGMPHGAMDWYIHRQLSGKRSLGASLLRFAPYTLLCVVSALVLFAVPVAYIAFFLLLTLLHFGRADARVRTGRVLANMTQTLRGVSRAASIVALPFAFQPAATGDAIARVSALVGGPASLPSGIAAVFGFFGVVGMAFWLIDAALDPLDNPLWQRLLPLVVLATGATLPPLFSVGLWFLLWHALRECVALGGEPRQPMRSLVRTHLRSAPLMIPTLGLALALGIVADAPAGVLGVAVVTLTLYAVFTPAHHLLQEIASARDPQFGTGAG